VKIAIIGGSGKMGCWFADVLQQEGHEVIITGRNEEKLLNAQKELGVTIASNREAIRSAEVVIISVQIDYFEEVVKEISPYIVSDQIILDVTSVKVVPMSVMHRYIKSGVILGTHPVFGPGARGFAGQNFVLTPTNDKESELAENVKKFLLDRNANVTLMTPEKHDEMMSVVLGLAHFVSIVAADTLSGFDNLPLMRAIGGSTYKVLVTLVESVISEDPELYAAIQMNLPSAISTDTLFSNNAELWKNLVNDRNRRGFVDRMNAVKRRLQETNPEFGRAYENMYKMVESL